MIIHWFFIESPCRALIRRPGGLRFWEIGPKCEEVYPFLADFGLENDQKSCNLPLENSH